jgi:hypothetical protein
MKNISIGEKKAFDGYKLIITDDKTGNTTLSTISANVFFKLKDAGVAVQG